MHNHIIKFLLLLLLPAACATGTFFNDTATTEIYTY